MEKETISINIEIGVDDKSRVDDAGHEIGYRDFFIVLTVNGQRFTSTKDGFEDLWSSLLYEKILTDDNLPSMVILEEYGVEHDEREPDYGQLLTIRKTVEDYVWLKQAAYYDAIEEF